MSYTLMALGGSAGFYTLMALAALVFACSIGLGYRVLGARPQCRAFAFSRIESPKGKNRKTRPPSQSQLIK
jgi:hypothetical protein